MKLVLVSWTVLLSTVLAVRAIAIEPADRSVAVRETIPPGGLGEPIAQIPSVSALSDVEPTDWAYEALRSLVDRYGCIQGYADGTFRGNRTLTRYEFAAALNACLENVLDNGLSESGSEEFPDLETISRLQAEYAAELTALNGQTQELEARTGELEAQQFSATVVMGGESIWGLTAGYGGSPPGAGETTPAFTHLTRLGLASSLTGRDRLRLELSSSNFDNRGFSNPRAFNTDMALLAFQNDTNNDVRLDKLEYRFPAFGDRVVFTARPVGFNLSSVLTANSPYFDAGRGSISRFTEGSPVFKIGGLDAGVGLDWLVSDHVRFQLAYGTRDGNRSVQGIFGADHSAIGAQVLLKPTANLLTGIAYVNAYASNGRLDVFSGSFRADTTSFLNAPTQFNAVTGTLQWRVTENLTFNTWGGLTFADAIDSDASATTTTYLFGLGYSDVLGRKGDLLAFLFGQPPKLVAGHDLPLGKDPDTSLHFEVFYRLGLTDNISITPGFFVVTNPEHDADNENIFVGVVRTTFRF